MRELFLAVFLHAYVKKNYLKIFQWLLPLALIKGRKCNTSLLNALNFRDEPEWESNPRTTENSSYLQGLYHLHYRY